MLPSRGRCVAKLQGFRRQAARDASLSCRFAKLPTRSQESQRCKAGVDASLSCQDSVAKLPGMHQRAMHRQACENDEFVREEACEDDDFVRQEACEDAWTIFKLLQARLKIDLMARTKQTARKYPSGRPPSPSRGQAPVRREAKKLRNMSDPESSHHDDDDHQQHDEASEHTESEQEEHEEGVNNEGGENDEDEEETVQPLDLLRMVKANEIRQHKGPWCIEMAKISYAHISHLQFHVKEDLSLFLKTDDKWVCRGIAAFMEEKSQNKDRVGVNVEVCNEKAIFVYMVLASQYDTSGMKKSLSKKPNGPTAKSLGFWAKDRDHWTDKRCLMELFWDVRLGMVDDHISTSQIVRTGLAVTNTNCSLTAKDIYVRLGRLEEKVKLEKSKRKADGAGPSNLKKARTADVDIQFKFIVTQTMGRKSHKEVIALVCCSDETFAAFEKFVKKWELGKIPDVQGNTNLVPNDKGVEQKRDFSQLSVNRFRPVNGLNDEDLRLVWNQLETGNVWVAKPSKYQGTDTIVSLRDFCKALKAKRSLATRIVKYWQGRYREVYDTWDELAAEYPFPPNWLDSMIKWVPEKAEKEMPADEASSSDLEDDDGNRRKWKSKKKVYVVEPLPSQVVIALHRVYQAKRGEYTPERLEPIEVLHVKDISKYQLTLNEKLDCQLVYLDLTHPFMVTWEKQEFSSFLSIVRDLTVAKHFTIVSVMKFGLTLVDFTSALKEMNDARVSFEYGCYEGPRVHKRSAMSYPCWQLMYVFVSLDAEDYKPVLVDDVTKRPFLIEYEPDSWLYEKEVAEGDDADNIKFRIPRWSFVEYLSYIEFNI
ncbi:hypothetical protein R1sor_019333 [Riccia sorocarpa]|uniref:Uncharacterized protein n=1 Tax=Riccia sorocarpa TaxID=122646 RepID=A0ABD3IDB1_9MARC